MDYDGHADENSRFSDHLLGRVDLSEEIHEEQTTI